MIDPERAPQSGRHSLAQHPGGAADHGAFDAFNPPAANQVADCIRCGFCLPACPTYALWGEEMDSPRGRIHLIRLALEGEVPIDRDFSRHFDACLGCMACVTACPSGVQYEDLLEATRPQIERQQRRSLGDRLFRRWVFAVFPHPARLRLAAMLLWMYQRVGVRSLVRRSGLRQLLPRRLAALDALAPDVRLAALWARLPERLPPVGPGRLKVGMLTGCVQSVFFADVNAATARVLTAEGCEVTVPTEQGCCGALEAHTGQQAAASQRAKAIITAFDDTGVDLVVTNAAGCGSNLKRYGRLLADDPAWAQRAAAFAARVRDVTELLVALEPRAARQPLPGRVAYHDACHLAHAQGLRREPRALLQSIPDLQLVDLPEPDMCCGSAGVYNLLEPEPAADLGRRKAELIRAAAPQAVASANPGCLLQLRRHLGDGLPLLHPVQLVDCSIRGVPPPWPDGISGKSVGGLG